MKLFMICILILSGITILGNFKIFLKGIKDKIQELTIIRRGYLQK
jgi:hypothetical protein